MRCLSILLLVFVCTPALGENIIIEMLKKDSDGNKMVFSEQVARINVGDTITWLPTSKGHNVEMIAAPMKIKFKSKPNKETSMTFETPGIYYYWCTPHKGMGMIGFVVVGNDKSNLEAVKKIRYQGKSKKIAVELISSL